MNQGLLAGKRALVTGGGVRLGKVIALALADAGASVAVHHHRSVEGAREVVAAIAAKGREAVALRADLADPEARARMFEALDAAFGGRLDVLVCSAAVFEKVPAAELTAERLRRTFALNVEAALACAQLARPRMLVAGGGAIVNLTDISAERPWRGYAHYCASKAALTSITRSLAVEWAPEIRVNAVAPGAVLLPEGTSEAEEAALVAGIPQQRLGSPEDVAQTVVFLAGGPATITGQVIAVDGGRSVSWRA